MCKYARLHIDMGMIGCWVKDHGYAVFSPKPLVISSQVAHTHSTTTTLPSTKLPPHMYSKITHIQMIQNSFNLFLDRASSAIALSLLKLCSYKAKYQ